MPCDEELLTQTGRAAMTFNEHRILAVGHGAVWLSTIHNTALNTNTALFIHVLKYILIKDCI